MKKIIAICALLSVAAATVSWADSKSYSPSGATPYLWATEGNWTGGTLPAAADTVTIADALLLTDPLFIGGTTSATATSCDLNNAILYVEEGGSLSVSDNMQLAPVLNGTGVVTNYGTITVGGSFDMGFYNGNKQTQKGMAARVDNYGTINIGTKFRISGTGTPSVFHNHPGATFNKTGGTDYSFYTACAAASTIINEGTWQSAANCQTWTGNSGNRTDIINKGTATFDPGKVFKIGHSGNSVTALNLYDSSKIVGNATFNVAAASGSKGYITLSNQTSLAAQKMNLGCHTKTLGVLRLADTTSAEFSSANSYVGDYVSARGEMHLEDSATVWTRGLYVTGPQSGCATGLVTLAGMSQLTNTTGAFVIGCYSNSVGTMTLRDSSALWVSTTAYLGHGDNGSHDNQYGYLSLTNSASAEFSGNYLHVGSHIGGTGVIELKGSSTLAVSNKFLLGLNNYSTGIVTVADSARIVANEVEIASDARSRGLLAVTNDATFICTNLIVCAKNTSDGEFLVGGTAICSNLTISAAGTTDGRVTVCDGGVLSCTNIMVAFADNSKGTLTVGGGARLEGCSNLYLAVGTSSVGTLSVTNGGLVNGGHIYICAYTGKNKQSGTLEVCEGGIVSNATINAANGSVSSACIAMRGGTMLFGHDDTALYNPLRLYTPSRADGSVRGWGTVAFIDPRGAVTESTRTSGCGMAHYGQIIADGEGVERDLDFSRFGVLCYDNTNPNTCGTNGWFAVNKGRLKLPRCLPRKAASHRCVGDYSAISLTKAYRLANSFTYTLAGASLNNYMFAELYAADRSDIPAGLDGLGANRIVSVYRIGHFSDGPEADEPTHPATFTSATVRFRYPTDVLDDVGQLCVYRHDGTANGRWRIVGKAWPSSEDPRIETGSFAPSAENWNLGWFAVVGRKAPFGTMFIMR